jgi:hypothetical protein
MVMRGLSLAIVPLTYQLPAVRRILLLLCLFIIIYIRRHKRHNTFLLSYMFLYKLLTNSFLSLRFFSFVLLSFILQGVFVYWCTNNVLSMAQGQVLKIPAIATYFDIPKAPVAAPALKITGNPIMKFIDAIRHPEKNVEVVDGSAAKAKAAAPIVMPSGPPPTTFSQAPKRKRTKK